MTGASSGFGLEMSRCALEHGDRVVATLRDPSALVDLASKYSSAQLLVAKVDVTNDDEIKAAFRRAKDAFGRVDIVFNNAGYVLTGEAETTPEELAKKLFEVDFWGAVRVSQEAVRFFREDNNPQGGFLIQNSAAAGIAAFPAMGFYTAAKHGKLLSLLTCTLYSREASAALEGFTDTLHKELDPAWNIKVLRAFLVLSIHTVSHLSTHRSPPSKRVGSRRRYPSPRGLRHSTPLTPETARSPPSYASPSLTYPEEANMPMDSSSRTPKRACRSSSR